MLWDTKKDTKNLTLYQKMFISYSSLRQGLYKQLLAAKELQSQLQASYALSHYLLLSRKPAGEGNAARIKAVASIAIDYGPKILKEKKLNFDQINQMISEMAHQEEVYSDAWTPLLNRSKKQIKVICTRAKQYERSLK